MQRVDFLFLFFFQSFDELADSETVVRDSYYAGIFVTHPIAINRQDSPRSAVRSGVTMLLVKQDPRALHYSGHCSC